MGSVFSYVPGNSFFHKLSPLTMFAAAFIVCIAVIVLAVAGNIV